MGLTDQERFSKVGPYLQPEDLPEFLKEVDRLNSTQIRQAFTLGLLTLVRARALTSAEIPDFDSGTAMWRVPASRTIGGIAHIVPLSRQALVVVEQLKAANEQNDFLFPSLRFPGTHMSPSSFARVISSMGYKGRVTVDGFRTTAEIILSENGFREEVIDRQLSPTKVPRIRRKRDSTEFLPERHEMMQWWADYLANLQSAPGV